MAKLFLSGQDGWNHGASAVNPASFDLDFLLRLLSMPKEPYTQVMLSTSAIVDLEISRGLESTSRCGHKISRPTHFKDYVINDQCFKRIVCST